MTGTDQPGVAHQARNPLVSVLLPSGPQIGVNTRCPIRLARGGVHGPDALQQRHAGHGVGRRRSVPPGVVARLGHAGHARHGAIGKQAWFALMNRKTRTAASRSPGQTRPRLLTRYPAPAGAGASRAGGVPTRRARPRLGQGQPPPGGPPACRPGQPRRRSNATTARTRGPGRPEIVRHAPDRPSGVRTQGNRLGGFWAS